MSARANSARDIFRRSLNSWTRPRPCGPVNRNQSPKRKIGIDSTIERFQKLIIDLSNKNAALSKMVDNFEQPDSTPVQREQLLTDFHSTLNLHREKLGNRLKKLNELEEEISIFRFDEREPLPPKKEFPPVNPRIPSPRAHLKTCPRAELAKTIAKDEHEHLTAKALYLERMIVIQKMKLKLFHDHRELAKLSTDLEKAEETPAVAFLDDQIENQINEVDIQIAIQDNQCENDQYVNQNQKNNNEDSNEENTKQNNVDYNKECNNNNNNDNNKERKTDNNDDNNKDNNNDNNKDNNEKNKEKYIESCKMNQIEINICNNTKTNDNEESKENKTEINDDNDGDDDEELNEDDEIESEKMKQRIKNLEEAIEKEKARIKQYQSKYINFFEAALLIQKTFKGFNYRRKQKIHAEA